MARGDITVRLLADTRDLERKFGDAGKRVSSVGDKMNAVGKKMTLGVTAPLLGLGTLAFNAAADLGESMNKVGAVFGRSAGSVEKFADTAARKLGISKQAALEASGTFGNLFRALKIGEEPAANMSTSLVTLAADLASFNNVSPEEALLALRSGLTGETEPLKKFGVNLNEATLKAKAMALGLSDGKGTLDASAKAQAAYALILEQTKIAQGDVGRTAGSAANQQRSLSALFSDLSAVLGEKLLPIGQKVIGFGLSLLDMLNGLSPGTQNVILVLGGLVAAVGPVLLVAAKLVKAFSIVSKAFGALKLAFMANPWFLLIAATVAITVLIIKNWDKIKKFLLSAWDAIKRTAVAVFGYLKDLFLNFTPLGQIIKNFDAIKNAFKGMVNFLIDAWNSIDFGISIKLPKFLGGFGFSVKDVIPDIPRLAEGGIVNRPTLAMIGEAGPEAVLPLGRGAGVGGNVYNITVNSPSMNPRELAGTVVQAVQYYEKRNGKGWRAL